MNSISKLFSIMVAFVGLVFFNSLCFADVTFVVDTKDVTVKPDSMAVYQIIGKNNDAAPKTIVCIQEVVGEKPEGWFVQLCIKDKCYAPNKRVTPAATMNPGEEIDFHINLTTTQSTGNMSIEFTVQDTVTKAVLFKDIFKCSNSTSSVKKYFSTNKNNMKAPVISMSGSNVLMQFTVPENDHLVSLQLFDMKGNVLNTIPFTVDNSLSTSSAIWTGDNNRGERVANGIYFVNALTTTQSSFTKIKLVR